MTGLKIVWKNPKASPRKRRWHGLTCDVRRRLYVVEELVVQGDQQRWAQSIALELISGRRAAAQTRPAQNHAASRDFHANKLLM